MSGLRNWMVALLALGAGCLLSASAFGGVAWHFDTRFGQTPARGDGELYYPSGIAVDDTSGDVYVADQQNQLIQRFTADGVFLAQWSHNGPLGLTVDQADHSVYAVSGSENCVYKYDPLGNVLLKWGSKGAGPGQFNMPRDVAVNPVTHDVFVLDSLNRRVEEFTSTGVFVQMWQDNQLYNPYGIDIDPTGTYVWIANSGGPPMVRKYTLTGSLVLSFGTMGSTPPAMRWPRGMAIDAAGNAYVAATDMERVQKFDPDGNQLQVFMGPATDALGPAHPRSVAVNRVTGDIYTTASYANRIDRFNAAGVYIQSWGHHDRDGSFLNTPRGIAVDPVNNVVYVGDNNSHLIKKFAFDGTFLGQYGNWPFVHRDETAVTFPGPVSVDAAGNYWVLNEGIIYPDDPTWGSDKFVRQFDASGNYLSGFANPDFGANMGGVVVNRAAQQIYVAVTNKNKIMRFAFDGTVLGSWGTKGVGPGQFNSPAGMALTSDGKYILVADVGNQRIQKFTLDGTYVMSFGSAGSAAGQFALGGFAGIAVDAMDNIYVADTGNKRVQVFDASGAYDTQIKSFDTGSNGIRSFFRPIAVAYANGKLFVLDTSGREVDVFDISKAVPPPAPLPSATDTVWVEDAIPTGAITGGNEPWNFVTTNPTPISGTTAHQSALSAGLHQHYFYNATNWLSVGVGSTMFAYVYLDPAHPPSEIMLEWRVGSSWQHRAYWGANKIDWGTDGTASRQYMGPLPLSGGWVRLEVPAAAVGLEGQAVNGMAFTLYDGQATWDAAGKFDPPPPPSASDDVWVDDGIPAGGVAGGNEPWKFVTTAPTPISGASAHQSALSGGMHQHFFYNATSRLSVGTGNTMFAYVYLDPANPPSEIMLEWRVGSSWNHRAYWGANSIGWGTDGTASRHYMGPLPSKGGWVRLEVPAADVGLEGQSVNGMSFTLYDGLATWDAAGKYDPLRPATPPSGSDIVWLEDAIPAGALTGGNEAWSFVTSNPTPISGAAAHQSTLSGGLHQHFFYNATNRLSVGAGNTMFAYVYLDPVNPPSEVMLEWRVGSSWQHRAYWGANSIGWGTDGTVSRQYMGELPISGGWVRLEVPAAAVGLGGESVNGMAFTLYGGQATWDAAGMF